MRFLALASFFGAAAVAQRAGDMSNLNEKLFISNYAIVTSPEAHPKISFRMSAKNATHLVCKSGEYVREPLPMNGWDCPFPDGSSKYNFNVNYTASDPSGYTISISHELAQAFGVSAISLEIPIVCAAAQPGYKTCVQNAGYVGKMTTLG
ncbi:hypothetical protein P3342_012567 [Pyrenophora teres f. teres]|uniref:AltA1 domain containing protein n=1 Tax=Pyrenophora teres f. teres TaxID=97479 RepID=A0A6S6WG82_9PLEO|nr:hypothetical protein HRS9139_08293 [Pyrenophora teres f. teres]KAE8832640.1 hypothetical protein PTNB85_07032 [Pyrenophora teres f. teres]KAE8836754.1 hypothetical protein HRS9122_06909 [Pyrenophora teres f. teres]KAE8856301.1 hypothetical protein PTNB29_09140 [Pyrenophora teres f. teres]KAE8860049.1 hypothetical protein PTNB73_07659 [Pyrenophora teres f. teres]